MSGDVGAQCWIWRLELRYRYPPTTEMESRSTEMMTYHSGVEKH